MNIAGLVPASQTAQYLRTLPSIRERCLRVFDLAKEGKLEYFEYHPEKEKDVAEFCAKLMKRDYPDFAAINPHGRWRHLDAGRPRVEPLISKWSSSSPPVDQTEILKRCIDLFIVSVLVDAGAGNKWSYKEEGSGLVFGRSEGLGVASVAMFEQGLFSSDEKQPYRVDAEGLAKLTVEKTAAGFQVSEANPMVGLEGRTSLLVNLAEALRSSPDLFGKDGRPGNMVDFLQSQSKQTPDTSKRSIPLSALWHVLIEGLNPIWPSRIQFGGISLGDVWPCDALKSSSSSPSSPSSPSDSGDDLVPFHKLTQWITYSLIEVLEKVANWSVEGTQDLTGLPEYRNGGLLVDLGVLSLKEGKLPRDEKSGLPSVEPSHPAIVEWRALTVVELDRIADLIRKQLNLSPEQLSLAQVLEGATWKGGREIAKEKRPETSGPPIEIQSDGTVF